MRLAVLPLALSLALSGCAREAVDTTPATQGPAAAETRAEGGVPVYVLIAIGALVLIVLALASADSDPFLDYSDICGTPDCS